MIYIYELLNCLRVHALKGDYNLITIRIWTTLIWWNDIRPITYFSPKQFIFFLSSLYIALTFAKRIELYTTQWHVNIIICHRSFPLIRGVIWNIKFTATVRKYVNISVGCDINLKIRDSTMLDWSIDDCCRCFWIKSHTSVGRHKMTITRQQLTKYAHTNST